MDDELAQQLCHSGPGPRNPAVDLDESTRVLPWQQSFTVVELTQEVDAAACRLHGVEELKTGARQPAGHRDPVEHVLCQELCARGDQCCGQSQRERTEDVDGAAVGDETRDALGTAVRGGLVAEHSALRISGKVDVFARDLPDRVDDLADGHDVVGEGPVHPADDLVRRTEVDHPGVETVAVEDSDCPVVGRDVVDVGRHHHRRHQHHGRTVAGLVREVPPQLVHRNGLLDPERGRSGPGLETAVPDDLQPVLGSGYNTIKGFLDVRKAAHKHP